MLTDGYIALLTIVGLPLLAILATLIAPKITKKASIYGEVVNYFELTKNVRGIPDRGIPDEIKLTVNGSEISDFVSIIEIEFFNNGHLDIAHDRFIDPIQIRLNSELKVLSATTNDDDESECETNVVNENTVHLNWRLLKQKEKFKITMLCSHEEELSFKEILKTQFVFRLRDVISSSRRRSVYKTGLAAVVAFLFIFSIFGGIILVDSLQSKPPLATVNGEVIAPIYDRIDKNKILVCKYYENRNFFRFRNCEKVELTALTPISPLKLGSVANIGVPKLNLFLPFLVAILYTTLGIYFLSKKRSATLRNMFTMGRSRSR